MLKKGLLFAFYLSSIYFSKTVCGQSLSDRVGSYVSDAIKEWHVPGLSLAVIRDGGPVKVLLLSVGGKLGYLSLSAHETNYVL